MVTSPIIAFLAAHACVDDNSTTIAILRLTLRRCASGFCNAITHSHVLECANEEKRYCIRGVEHVQMTECAPNTYKRPQQVSNKRQ